jgi:hypothetical protein
MMEQVKFKIFCERLIVTRELKLEVTTSLVGCETLESSYMHKFR